jgi:hypothetical protein
MPLRARHSLTALALLLPLAPAAALAAAATASQNVNVRSGPATSYPVLTQLHRGDAVDVRQCEGSFCQVTFGTNGTGWVSATYLTRDYVPPATPAPPIVATTTPSRPTTSSDLPPLPSGPRGPGGGPSDFGAPGVASAAPPAHGAMPLPQGTFPPAYGDDENPSPGDMAAAGPPDTGDPGLADDGAPYSSVTLPDDSGDVIASTGDVPRPQADVPNGARSGPDDEYADLGGDSPDAADMPGDVGPYADDGPYGPPRGWGGRFGGPGGWRGGPGNRACFVSGSNFGGQSFCLRAGQTVSDLGPWSRRIYALRNPRGLVVTVCTFGPGHDCHVYRDSGPIFLGEAGVASISVSPPGY